MSVIGTAEALNKRIDDWRRERTASTARPRLDSNSVKKLGVAIGNEIEVIRELFGALAAPTARLLSVKDMLEYGGHVSETGPASTICPGSGVAPAVFWLCRWHTIKAVRDSRTGELIPSHARLLSFSRLMGGVTAEGMVAWCLTAPNQEVLTLYDLNPFSTEDDWFAEWKESSYRLHVR